MTQEYNVITDPRNPLCGKSYEEVKEIVRKDVYALQCVKEQTEEICKIAVRKDGWALAHIWPDNQTEELCKIAVRNSGFTLQYVKNQTEEICKLAVKQNGHALQFVEKQTAGICNLALKQTSEAMKYVNKDLFDIKLTVRARV